jgi:hypothetical protein
LKTYRIEISPVADLSIGGRYMSVQMSDDEIRKLAQRRVAAKKGFFTNLATFLVINAMLFVIWMVGGGGYLWFLWVAGFWGVGLLFHAFNVFLFPREGGDWEQREIQKEMAKIKKGHVNQ